MKTTFKKGQKIVCTHYKDKPIVVVIDVRGATEVWVKSIKDVNADENLVKWWGPVNWFQKMPK
jgi:hypothetical protein